MSGSVSRNDHRGAAAAERKRLERERKRASGFVLRQFWVHPKDWGRVHSYLLRVNKKRESRSERV